MLCAFRQAQDLPGPATFHLLLFFAPVRRLFGAAGRGAPRQALLHGLPHGPGQAWLCLAVWGLQGRRRTGSYPHPVRFVVLIPELCARSPFLNSFYTHTVAKPHSCQQCALSTPTGESSLASNFVFTACTLRDCVSRGPQLCCLKGASAPCLGDREESWD